MVYIEIRLLINNYFEIFENISLIIMQLNLERTKYNS